MPRYGLERQNVFLILLLAIGLSGCAQDCSYAHRLWDTQCRKLAGSVSTLRIPPPNCFAATNVRAKLSSCSFASAALCNDSSNGAAVYALLLGADTAARDCFDVWNGDATGSIPSVFSGLPYKAYYSPFNAAVNCTAAGCSASDLDSCFVTFDTSGASSAANLQSGTYKLCYFIDTYQTMISSSPLVMNSDSQNSYNGIFGFFNGAYGESGDLLSSGGPFIRAGYVNPAVPNQYCAAPFSTAGCASTYPTMSDLWSALQGQTPWNPPPPAVPGTKDFQIVTIGSGTVLDFSVWMDFQR